VPESTLQPPPDGTPDLDPGFAGLALAEEAPPKLAIDLTGRMRAGIAGGPSVMPLMRKSQAVLAVLAIMTPQPVRREFLTRLLWSQSYRAKAQSSLRQAVRDLRESLELAGIRALEVQRDTLRLRREEITLRLWDEGDPGSLLESFLGLDPAFDLWIATLVADHKRGVPPGLSVEGPSAAPNRRLRIGVMPLQVAPDGAAAQPGNGLATGLVHEIITALSRSTSLSVHSVLAMADLRQALPGETTRFDLVLNGSVQDGRAAMRVNLHLHDMRQGGEVVWARRYDRPSRDLLAIQDEIAGEIVMRVLEQHPFKWSHMSG
jgi:TolB-like protein